MNESRAFGCEIECLRADMAEPSPTEQERWLFSAGRKPMLNLPEPAWVLSGIETEKLLNTHSFSDWETNLEEAGYVEIRSPALHGPKGLDELRRVLELLEREGFYVTDAHGFHVHHDAPEWVWNHPLIAYTLELWEERLPEIRKRVAPWRTDSEACTSYAECDLDTWDRLRRTGEIEPALFDRSRALNIIPLWLGRLEFRLHQSTLDFEKAAAWIKFTQDFMEGALHTYRAGTGMNEGKVPK